MFGDKQFRQYGFPTPTDTPSDLACRTLQIPSSAAWLGVVMGALMALTDEKNWQQFEGGISTEDAAAVALEILDNAYANITETCGIETQTPYWADDDEVEDTSPPELQTWYGHTDGNDFITDAADFVLQGFIAVGVSPHAAIAYRTLVPRMRVAFRRGDFGGLVNIFVDGVKTLDFSTYLPSGNDVIEVPLTIDPDAVILDESVEILIESAS